MQADDALFSNSHQQEEAETEEGAPSMEAMAAAAVAPVADHTSASEQTNRRKRIKEIMADPSLSQQEKSKAVQALMDGRRQSMSSRVSSQPSSSGEFHQSDGGDSVVDSQHYASIMARAAAQAHEYFSSDDDDDQGDAFMDDGDDDDARPEDVAYGYGRASDDRSVASSVTHTSFQSTNTNIDIPRGMSYRQVHGRSYSLQDWSDNDRVIAAASNTNIFGNPAQISRMMEISRPQCDHYERNCTVVSPCCGLAFGCRICHDDCPVLPIPFNMRRKDDNDNNDNKNNNEPMLAEQMTGLKQHKTKMDRRRSMPLDLEEEEETHHHHAIDRFLIREVICRSCYLRQSSKANNCVGCGIQFGDYHCNICNLWMAARESPYHCSDCGFCRVGGRENFRHCDDCGMCIDTLLFDDHNCKAGKYMSNCPVCQEDLFSSRYASHEMPCGHAIHWHCFKELTSYDTRCPVCKKTAETPEHMASTWSVIAMGIALQPVPPEMARVVNIFCNDCEVGDSNRRWHFLGVRCMNCMSFNTNVEQIVMQGCLAADYLDELEASNANKQGVPANIAIASSSSLVGAAADAMEEDPPSAEFSSGGSTGTGNDMSQLP